jgi:hypothetical protein
MRSFATQLDWVPSYDLPGTFGVDQVVGHLVVEHGLGNSAVISFIKTPFHAAQLSRSQINSLLTISYNNLIEWHLFISGNDARWVNNLWERSEIDPIISLDQGDLLSAISSSKINELERKSFPIRAVKPCDDALLQVISRWKQLLKADYPSIGNHNLSALFNGIILVRGCEDSQSLRVPPNSKLLLHLLTLNPRSQVDVITHLRRCLEFLDIGSDLANFVNTSALEPFQTLDFATAENLFRDFYTPRNATYVFNFALMSKHALSRIYEKYVAIFRDASSQDSSLQLSLIGGSIPAIVSQRSQGAIYTPQFVAGFFARFIRENVTPRSFRSLRSIDPACGSGLFLRSLLELQCDPMSYGVTRETIRGLFSSAEGIDRDTNACEATRLSLALLHLIATEALPKSTELKVINADSIASVLDGTLELGAYGAVMTNPPYVKLDNLSPDERELYRRYLGDDYNGRIDAYIPFVRLCLDLSQAGGMVCLVLPQTFLTAFNAFPLRKMISEGFDIRCLVDLSAVPVFDNVGAYPILLILQRRRSDAALDGPLARVAHVTESVGAALQACLDGSSVESKYFSVFGAPQSIFLAKNWVILSPEQMHIDGRLANLPRLSDFMTVAQGFVTGADSIFIREREAIPRGEEDIYLDFLPDREIGRYHVPKKTSAAVFFPFSGGKPLSEDEIIVRFPETWKYLSAHREELSRRKSVSRSKAPWWRPVRSRDPSVILMPKIVCPHLMLTPRFALDVEGKLAVSHSPFIIAKDSGEQLALIRFFCAVLNSTVGNWYIRTYAPKYAKGYNRLEVSLLNSVPVPDMRRYWISNDCVS